MATSSLPWPVGLTPIARVWRSGVQAKERWNWQLECFRQKLRKASDWITHNLCQSTKDQSCYCTEAFREASSIRFGSFLRRTQSGSSSVRCWLRERSMLCCRWTTSSVRTSSKEDFPESFNQKNICSLILNHLFFIFTFLLRINKFNNPIDLFWSIVLRLSKMQLIVATFKINIYYLLSQSSSLSIDIRRRTFEVSRLIH